MSVKYTYSISNDFINQKASVPRLTVEIQESIITRALDYISTYIDDCDIWFKDSLSYGEELTLSGVVSMHTGAALLTTPPLMPDGRPLVATSSRPVGHYTVFTMSGDTASGIGDGKDVLWDFSNNEDIMASGVAPSGYKGKTIDIQFLDPIYIKELALYFYGANKSSYLDLSVVCPNGEYYYDRDEVLTQAQSDVVVHKYVHKHYFYGDCPMGDELNTESANEDAIPTNHMLRLDVYVPISDVDSYGYVELELYRERTCLLPGETV